MALRAGRFSDNARVRQAAENEPSLKQGEKGEGVAIVQQALVDLRFQMPVTTSQGRSLADGIFGAETVRIVKQFQAANGLVVDGIVGRNTLEKLDDLILALSVLKEALFVAIGRNDFTLQTAKPPS